MAKAGAAVVETVKTKSRDLRLKHSADNHVVIRLSQHAGHRVSLA